MILQPITRSPHRCRPASAGSGSARRFFSVALTLAAIFHVSEASVAQHGQGQTPHKKATDKCPEILVEEVQKVFGLGERRKNHLIFNHEKGLIEWPVPAQLEVEDGETFAIIFACSDSSKFDYKIEGVESESADGTTFTTVSEFKKDHYQDLVSFTWRHDRRRPLYKVTVSKKKAKEKTSLESFSDETRPLFSYTFPIWVKTDGWQLTFSSGFGFSELYDERYFVKTDDLGNDDASDDVKTIERDRSAENELQPDLMALANLAAPDDSRFRNWGLAFGLGIGNDSEPRYFLGPSYHLGRNFILTAGLAGGNRATLPVGQELGMAPINGDNTLTTPHKKFDTSLFLGIAFSFAPAEKEFLAALKEGVQKVPEEQANTTGEPK